MTVEQASVNH